MIIGRDARCDIVLPGQQVSKRHAEVRSLGDGTFALTDLDSRNGTYVNGTRIRSARVQATDLVSFGGFETTLAAHQPMLARKDVPRPAPSHAAPSIQPARGEEHATDGVRSAIHTPMFLGRGWEPELLLRFWQIDLLRPALKVARTLVSALVAIGGVVVVYGAAHAADRSGELAAVLLVGGAIALGFLYVILMLFPEFAALVVSIERHTRPNDRERAPVYRNVGIQAIAVMWRCFAIAMVIAGLLLPLNWMAVTAFRRSGAAEEIIGRSIANRIGGLWPLVTNVSMLAVIVLFVWLLVQDHQSRRSPRLFTTVMGFVAFPIGAMFLSAGSETFTPGPAGSSLIVLGWAAAAVVCIGKLLSGDSIDESLRGVYVGFAIFGTLLFLLKGGVVVAGLGEIRLLLLRITGQKSVVTALADLVPDIVQIGGGASIVTALLLMLPTMLAGVVTWLKSDAAKTVLDIERNLRPGALKLRPSPYVMYARIVTYGVAGAVALFVALSLRLSAEVAQAIERLLGPSARYLVTGFDEVEMLWMAIGMIVGLTAAFDLVRISFDLVAYTARSDAPAVSGFWALRIIVALQYAAAAVLALVVVALAWKSSDTATVRLAGVLVAVVVFLTFSFVAALLHNLLKLEANVRVAGGTRFANAKYPSLSFVATGGKVVVWLICIAAGLATLKVADYAGRDNGPGVLLAGAAAVVLLFIFLSAIPDFVRLLLTLEDDFVRRRLGTE